MDYRKLTDDDKQTLSGLCRIEIKRWKSAADSNPNIRYMVELMEVALASLMAESGWVKCSERMPPVKTGVLVTTEMDGPGDWRMKWATFVPGHPDAADGWLIPGASWTPTHWKPLPAPPEE